MVRKSTSRFIILLVPVIALTYAMIDFSHDARAFSTGAPAAHCGAPADAYDNCTQCHSSYPVNSVVNAITSNIPANGYVPLNTYTITATIAKPGHARYGFEISPQSLSGNLLGSMNDINSETTFTGLGKYITHSTTGTLSNNSKTWQFEWTAPAAGTGSVTFYGAFNATNNDGGPTGDSIFLTTYVVDEDLSNGIAGNTHDQHLEAWVDAQQTLHVRSVGEVDYCNTITVLDLSGKTVKIFQPLNLTDRGFELNTDISDLSPGLYFVRAENGQTIFCTRIFIQNR